METLGSRYDSRQRSLYAYHYWCIDISYEPVGGAKPMEGSILRGGEGPGHRFLHPRSHFECHLHLEDRRNAAIRGTNLQRRPKRKRRTGAKGSHTYHWHKHIHHMSRNYSSRSRVLRL